LILSEDLGNEKSYNVPYFDATSVTYNLAKLLKKAQRWS